MGNLRKLIVAKDAWIEYKKNDGSVENEPMIYRHLKLAAPAKNLKKGYIGIWAYLSTTIYIFFFNNFVNNFFPE